MDGKSCDRWCRTRNLAGKTKAIRDGGFPATELHAQPGDVLLWHANLLHGGKKMSSPNASRKSMVIHCLADDVLCYHELTQQAARMEGGN